MLCGVASVPAWILAAPNAAQSEHLWQRLRGYPATVLTVPLQHDDPAQQQAVLALLEPLRTLGSRRIGVRQQGRHGGWTDTDVVPAYIRVQDKHLQVALARALPAEVLAHFEQLLQVLQDEDVAQQPWSLVAAWHCRLQETRPLEPWGPRTPQLRAMQQRIRQCEGPRSEALVQAVALLAGQTGTLEIEQTERFSPWWSRPGWSRWTPVPEADVLQPCARWRCRFRVRCRCRWRSPAAARGRKSADAPTDVPARGCRFSTKTGTNAQQASAHASDYGAARSACGLPCGYTARTQSSQARAARDR